MTVAAELGTYHGLQPDLHDSYYSVLYDLLEEKRPVDEVAQSIAEFIKEEQWDTPFKHLEGYRKCLALHLICQLRKDLKEPLDNILLEFRKLLEETQTWEEFQLATAYKKLIEELSSTEITNLPRPVVYDEGFAPLESGNHWTWASVPLQPFHAELGVIWALLGHEVNQHDLISAAHQIATFQFALLDEDYLPLQGLYTQEKDAGISGMLAWCAALFHSIGHAFQKNDLLAVAETQIKTLQLQSKAVHPLIPLLFRWKPFGKTINQLTKPNLPNKYSTPSLGLYVYRNEQVLSVSSLYGGRTGMGTFHVDKTLSIINFGPQYQPYGDCQGFGVEGSTRNDSRFPNISIDENSDGYVVKGYTKVGGTTIYDTPYAIAGNSNHSEVWLDVRQQFSEGVFDLQVNYLSYSAELPLSFVFYIKARECEINGIQTLKPKSLDRYHGDAKNLVFDSNEKSISLVPACSNSVMEVIPLAGDDSFWGSDFLVGFSVDENVRSHCFQIKSN